MGRTIARKKYRQDTAVKELQLLLNNPQFEPPIGVAEGFPYRLTAMPKHPLERRYWAVS